jgi:hypothetical protein
MDPKALSHLDPKARETYDRIMGTAHDVAGTTPNDPQLTTSVPADTTIPDTSAGSFSAPTDLSGQNAQTAYNSDLGQIVPTSAAVDSAPVSSMPDDSPTPSIFSTPPPSQDTTPSSDTMANGIPSSPNSSFFINPSPADTAMPAPSEPSSAFAPIEPPQDPMTQAQDPLSPVTPYQPESAPPITASAEPFAQPLPSPADVNQQAAPHETSPLLKVLYIVGAAIFFAIYTIFWIKVFNLPFLF